MIGLGDAARNKWRSILPALGISADFLTGKHGPCPLCGGKDRFRFDDRDGRGTWFCSACDPRAGDGISLLQRKHGWSFGQCSDHVRPLIGEAVEERRNERPRGDPKDASRRLWEQGRPLTAGDPAARYLASRGLTGSSRDLRFFAECPVKDVPEHKRLPAMLALVRAPDGSGQSVHRTYLGPSGKADIDSPRRMMPGTLPPGSAIRLSAYDGVLGVAEGIETALAVMRDFEIPCWSVINATMLQKFVWPDDVRELVVFGDHDRKYAGQAAAFELARRASVAPKPILARVEIPPTPGDDWLDHGNGARARHAA